MGKAVGIVLGGIFAGCVLIVTIVLISCSFAKVEMTEVGILYSHASRKIDRKQLYTAGRHYVGVGGEFITFPITQQELHLPIFESRTKDGLVLNLDVSLNFEIIKDFDKIIKIFDHFGYHYDGYISRLAMNTIRDASAQFTAIEYSQNRSVVNLEMQRSITDDMNEIGFKLDSLQLLNVEFPASFSFTLQEIRIAQQNVSQAQRKMNAEIVLLDGELSRSATTANGIIAEANGTATSLTKDADAQYDALIDALREEAYSHKGMIDFFCKIEKNKLENEEDPSLGYKECDTDGTDDTYWIKARKHFTDWYWMNQVADSPAAKNVAVSLPDTIN